MSDYIMDLRKLVGHIPLVICSAGAVVVNDCNEVLLLHRSDNDLWGLPGGVMEPGETIEETARREVFEETGLKLGEIKLLGVYSGMDLHYIYPNEDEVFLVANVFLAREFTGQMAGDGMESKAVKFFNINNLPESINPPDIPILKDFICSCHPS